MFAAAPKLVILESAVGPAGLSCFTWMLYLSCFVAKIKYPLFANNKISDFIFAVPFLFFRCIVRVHYTCIYLHYTCIHLHYTYIHLHYTYIYLYTYSIVYYIISSFRYFRISNTSFTRHNENYRVESEQVLTSETGLL